MKYKEIFTLTDDMAEACLVDTMESIKRRVEAAYVVLDGRVNPKTITSLIATKLALELMGIAYNQEFLVEGRKPVVILDALSRKLNVLNTESYFRETERAIKDILEKGLTGAIRTEYKPD